MGTIVAVASEGGAVIAGDTRDVDGGTVTSARLGRVFDFGNAGAGVVGAAGDIQTFGRRLESELETWRLERGGEIELDALARIAARVARETTVDAVVGARDSDEGARLREVGADGRVVEGPETALGSGAETALGRLEAIDRGRDVDDLVSAARDTVGLVMERDATTGGDIDVWSLSSDSSTRPDDH
jgi:proteasome beta subunit